MVDFQKTLDTRNENCPIPVMKAKKELRAMSSGDILYVIATDPACVQDITMLLKSLGHELVDSSESGGEYHFYIRKVEK